MIMFQSPSHGAISPHQLVGCRDRVPLAVFLIADSTCELCFVIELLCTGAGHLLVRNGCDRKRLPRFFPMSL
ncbi:uncharacterized protein ARMOST_13597 [Armillaria ostoyae]|uniref:Uncharacterized protein n=1 Tax=Armillaria ostoyae TaxID=47428 RepID=A0A284RN67_ARMOS|nr:uncharacterized protein ARMOST_13597 [Armillaria ostoyae]